MFARRLLLVCAVALSVVRCADQPTAVQRPAAPHFVPWAGNAAPQFRATSIGAKADGRFAFQSPPISLETYQTSFWAVRGESRSVRINYLDAEGGTEHPFLEFTTSDPKIVPNVGELAMGDSVLITVQVDTTKLGVKFEPTGLQFGDAAHLQVWYGGAGGDLNGDGAVDSVDTNIESQLLGVWYREGDEPWSPIPAEQLLSDKSFNVALPHFSEYILGFLESIREWAVSW